MTISRISKVLDMRIRAQTELQALYSSAVNRDLSGDEQTRESNILNDLTRLQAEERALVSEAAAKESRLNSERNSWMHEGSATANGSADIAAFQNELRSADKASMSLSLERRDDVALLKSTATDGSELVTPRLHQTIWDFYQGSDAVLPALTTVTSNDGSPLLVPAASSHSTASIIAEGTAITRSAPQFNQVSVPVYKYAILTQHSRELAADTGVGNFEQFVVKQGVEALGRAFAAHVISGSGSGQPDGIDTAVTVTETTAAIAAVTALELIDAYHAIATPYRRNASWAFADSTLLAIRKLTDGQGNYLWTPGLSAGQPDVLLGRPILETVSLPAMATAVAFGLFGDFSRVGVAHIAGGVDVESSKDFAFDTDLITTKMVMRAGFELVDESAMVVISNA
ncbi:MAG: phage major capsid protein [Acidimicrobiales bacterium]